MQSDTSLDWIPDITSVIEYSPLIVSLETPLVDAIAMISQTHYPSCSLLTPEINISSSIQLSSNEQLKNELRTSCVLVVKDRDLVGIITARDIVKITAQQVDFRNAIVADYMTSPIISMPQRSVNDIFAVLFLFRRYQIRHLPLIGDEGELIGVISHENIQHTLRPANLLRFRRVTDVMTREVISASLETSILQLAELMAQHRVSCVVITKADDDDNHRPIGIITERDIVQFHVFQLDFATTQAQTVMSTPLFLLSPEDSLWTAHQEMKIRRVGRMVVSWNWGKGLGIVTQTSLLKIFDPMEMYGVIENMQQTIQQLEMEMTESNTVERSKSLSITMDTKLTEQKTTQKLTQKPILIDVYATIKYLIDNLDLSKDEQRSHLQSALDNINSIELTE